MTRGTDALEARISKFADGACTTRARLFLAGYSQGAEVVDGVLASLPSRLGRLIDGVVLFGDPRFNSAQELPVDVGTFNTSLDGVAPYQFHPPTGSFGTFVSYTAAEAPLVRSYCANHDQICDYSSPAALAGCAVRCAHFHYMDLRVTTSGAAPTYTQAGAAFLVSRLHSPLAPPPRGGAGTVSPDGTVGPLTIDRSDRSAVISFAGQPDAEAVHSLFGGPEFDALGYGCAPHETTTEAPVGTMYCQTAFYIDTASEPLSSFLPPVAATTTRMASSLA